MNYIYRANGHLFVLLYRTPVLEIDPNTMTHWERVLHYYPLPFDLGDGIDPLMAFLPPHMADDDYQIYTKDGVLKDHIYFITEGKLCISMDDEICLIEDLPEVFHNLDVKTYEKEMVRYIHPFEFIAGLDHQAITTDSQADHVNSAFLKMMDGFQEVVVSHYINEVSHAQSSLEVQYSLIPRTHHVPRNEPIVLH